MRTWLKDIRLEKHLTELTVARRAGIAQPFYHNIEMGKKNPSPATAQRIADVLEFDWTRFFTDGTKGDRRHRTEMPDED